MCVCMFVCVCMSVCLCMYLCFCLCLCLCECLSFCLSACQSESSHTYECVISHVWKSHVTQMNESRHNMNDSCHTYTGAMPLFHVSCICTSDSAHVYVLDHTSNTTPLRFSLFSLFSFVSLRSSHRPTNLCLQTRKLFSLL